MSKGKRACLRKIEAVAEWSVILATAVLLFPVVAFIFIIEGAVPEEYPGITAIIVISLSLAWAFLVLSAFGVI